MAHRGSRARKGSRLGVESGERYALLPLEIVESGAYAALPDWARSVFVALCTRYNGHSNGNLSLPFSEARRLGIAAQWKLYASLRLLETVGLILCTRRGKLQCGKKLPSLYALTWRGIDACDVAYDAGVTRSPIPLNLWVKWSKPIDWRLQVQAIARANHGRAKKNPVTTMLGNGRSTKLGATGVHVAQPPLEKEMQIVAPNVVDTSKTPPNATGDPLPTVPGFSQMISIDAGPASECEQDFN